METAPLRQPARTVDTVRPVDCAPPRELRSLGLPIARREALSYRRLILLFNCVETAPLRQPARTVDTVRPVDCNLYI